MTNTQDPHAMPDILAMLDEIRRQNDAMTAAKKQEQAAAAEKAKQQKPSNT